MGITDWNKWMTDHGIYIPTAEEIELARKENLVKVRRLEKDFADMKAAFEDYREKVRASR